MKKTAATAAVVLAFAVTVSGCSSAAAEQVAPSAPVGIANVPTESAEPTTEPEPTAAPADERPTADAPGTLSEVDALYVAHTRDRATDQTDIGAPTRIPSLSDQELLDLAGEACAQLPTVGGEYNSVRLFDAETPDPGGYYWDSMTIAALASVYYCTEWEPDVVVPWSPDGD